LPAAAKDKNFRILGDQLANFIFLQVLNVVRIPAEANLIPKKNDVFRHDFVADPDHALFDMTDGDGCSWLANEFHQAIIAEISKLSNFPALGKQ